MNVARHSQAAKQSARFSQSIAVMEQILHNRNVEQQYTAHNNKGNQSRHQQKYICGTVWHPNARTHKIQYVMVYAYTMHATKRLQLCVVKFWLAHVFSHTNLYTEKAKSSYTCGGFMLNGKRVNNCFDLPHGTLFVVMYKFNLRWWFSHRLIFCHAELLRTACKVVLAHKFKVYVLSLNKRKILLLNYSQVKYMNNFKQIAHFV